MGKKTIWYQATVQEITRISDTKLILSIEVKSDDLLDFIPGQFATFDLPIGDRRQQRWRSYSIANISNPENILEFAIGHLEGGAASDYFFDQLRVGDHLKLKGPEGNFILPQNLDRPIVMIATGTGVVPFVSMLRYIFQNDLTFQSIHLIYGSRYEKDLLFQDELLAFERSHEHFTQDIILSREKRDDKMGYVHEIYQHAYPDQNEDILYLLCGWTNMIDEAMANLFSKVVSPPRQIKYELYG